MARKRPAKKLAAATAARDSHASTQSYIDYMRPRCVELARAVKKTGSFYYHRDWRAWASCSAYSGASSANPRLRSQNG